MTPSVRRILFPILGVLLLVAASLYFYQSKTPPSPYNFDAFGTLPAHLHGRIQPLDSIAKNTLLSAHGHRRAKYRDGSEEKAIVWLATALMEPEVAREKAFFRVQDPEVRSLLGNTAAAAEPEPTLLSRLFGYLNAEYLFSYNELEPHIENIQNLANQAARIESLDRSHFQSETLNLWKSVSTFQRLNNTFRPNSESSFDAEITQLESFVPQGLAALDAYDARSTHDPNILKRMNETGSAYQSFIENSYFAPIPPDEQSSEWQPIGSLLTRLIENKGVPQIGRLYAQLGDAYRSHDAPRFNAILDNLVTRLRSQAPSDSNRAAQERFINYASPFTVSMCGYAFAFLFALLSWRFWPNTLNYLSNSLLVACLIFHTCGLALRFLISDHAPIYSHYATALLAAWIVVFGGIILEAIFKNSFSNLAASLSGCLLLAVAQSLAHSGNTLGVLPAEFAGDFTLPAHIVAITIGQSAAFLVGSFAFVALLAGLFTIKITPQNTASLSLIIYTIACAGTLLSFFGSLLGGAWADNAFGRFWGWDPKENGILMLVIWFAVIIHCHWAKRVQLRGLAALSFIASIVAAWSWFGSDLINFGYRSEFDTQYGLFYLLGFACIQIVLCSLVFLPKKYWKSYLED